MFLFERHSNECWATLATFALHIINQLLSPQANLLCAIRIIILSLILSQLLFSMTETWIFNICLHCLSPYYQLLGLGRANIIVWWWSQPSTVFCMWPIQSLLYPSSNCHVQPSYFYRVIHNKPESCVFFLVRHCLWPNKLFNLVSSLRFFLSFAVVSYLPSLPSYLFFYNIYLFIPVVIYTNYLHAYNQI